MASATLAVGDAGLASGVRYYVRVLPDGPSGWFDLSMPFPFCAYSLSGYEDRAWADAGREWLARYGGMRWLSREKQWQLDPAWDVDGTQVAQRAYYLEQAIEPALTDAQARHELGRLDELAGYYLSYYPRFTTLGALRRRGSLTRSTRLLDNQGPDNARTLPWVERASPRDRVRECTLCTSQFFHPAARLIRLIALLPASERTPRMTKFIDAYLPLIVNDHLLRLGYVAEWDYWGARDLPKHLVDIWSRLSTTREVAHPSYQHAMLDSDLWLIAASAEILAANVADPTLVPLGSKADSLRHLVNVGVSFFQSHRHEHPGTVNSRGEVVGSVSYFDGEFDDHPTMAFARDTLPAFPDPTQPQPPTGGSWDISHASRIPIFLRALYDTRRATGLAYPTARELQLASNQYLYQVFEGNLTRPLFRNFLDGSDGWYRVSERGRDSTGFPPSRFCDQRNPHRPCLADGAVMGWGLLSFSNPPLQAIGVSLLELAAARDSGAIDFRDRYYAASGPFAFVGKDGREAHSLLLFSVIGEYVGANQQCNAKARSPGAAD